MTNNSKSYNKEHLEIVSYKTLHELENKVTNSYIVLKDMQEYEQNVKKCLGSVAIARALTRQYGQVGKSFYSPVLSARDIVEDAKEKSRHIDSSIEAYEIRAEYISDWSKECVESGLLMNKGYGLLFNMNHTDYPNINKKITFENMTNEIIDYSRLASLKQIVDNQSNWYVNAQFGSSCWSSKEIQLARVDDETGFHKKCVINWIKEYIDNNMPEKYKDNSVYTSEDIVNKLFNYEYNIKVSSIEMIIGLAPLSDALINSNPYMKELYIKSRDTKENLNTYVINSNEYIKFRQILSEIFPIITDVNEGLSLAEEIGSSLDIFDLLEANAYSMEEKENLYNTKRENIERLAIPFLIKQIDLSILTVIRQMEVYRYLDYKINNYSIK